MTSSFSPEGGHWAMPHTGHSPNLPRNSNPECPKIYRKSLLPCPFVHSKDFKDFFEALNFRVKTTLFKQQGAKNMLDILIMD